MSRNIPQYLNKLGFPFIAYCLNIPLEQEARFYTNEFEFSTQQKEALDKLDEIFKAARVESLNAYDTDHSVLFSFSGWSPSNYNKEHIAHELRRISCGDFPSFPSDDELISTLNELACYYYPNLVASLNDPAGFPLQSSSFMIGSDKKFTSLIEEDSSLSKLFYDDCDMRIGRIGYWATNIGSAGPIHSSFLLMTLLSNSFRLSACRGNISLESVIKHIKEIVNLARKLAANESVNVPEFFGIYNYLIDADFLYQFNLTDKHTLRPINNTVNHLIPRWCLPSTSQDGIIGITLEGVNKLHIYKENPNEKYDLRKYKEYGSTQLTSKKNVDDLLFSIFIAFHTKENKTSGCYAWRMYFNPFVSVGMGSRSSPRANSNYKKLSKMDLLEIKKWFERVSSTNDNRLSGLKSRLTRSYFERDNDTDAYLDIRFAGKL